MRVYVGTFTASTSLGPQAITGLGFQPKAVVLWGSYQTADGFADGYLTHQGMTDGTNQYARMARSEDNTGTFVSRGQVNQSAVVDIVDLSGTSLRVGVLDSFDADGFTIDWTTVDAVAARMQFIAFGGDDVTAELASVSQAPFSTTATIEPAVALLCATFAGGNSSGIGWFAVDPDDGLSTQGAIAFGVANGSGGARSHQRTVLCGSHLNTALSLFAGVTKTALGVTASLANNATTYSTLILRGNIRAAAGSITQPTSTGTQAITGVGFTPKAVLIAGYGFAESTVVQNGVSYSCGAGDGTRQAWSWVGAVHNANPGVRATGQSSSAIAVAATPDATGANTTARAEAALVSLDADGFTLDWTSADATQRQFLYLAFGDAPSSGSGGGAFAYAFMG